MMKRDICYTLKEKCSFGTLLIIVLVGLTTVVSVNRLLYAPFDDESGKRKEVDGENVGESRPVLNYTGTWVASKYMDISRMKFSWLMSYPNSGTSYTMRMTTLVSQRMTASNYGKEHIGLDGSTIVFDEKKYASGPFPKNETLLIPKGYMLTKTHCGARCTSCAPNKYLLTLPEYQEECLRGDRKVKKSEGKNRVHYSPEIIERAVHLYRNPFDNIVSRFHLHWNSEKKINSDSEWINAHPRNATGFRLWCHQMDVKFPHKERDLYGQVPDLALIPCHSEFYRYVQWHNLASEVVRTMDIPLHIMHYEDYDDDFDKTVADLFSFLELEKIGKAPEFHSGDYSDHYSSNEREAAIAMMKSFASNSTWFALSNRYEF